MRLKQMFVITASHPMEDTFWVDYKVSYFCHTHRSALRSVPSWHNIQPQFKSWLTADQEAKLNHMGFIISHWVSLAQLIGPGRYGLNSKVSFSNSLYRIVSVGNHFEIVLRWMPHDLSNKKSTFVQVMAWCCQTASHCLNQCWHRSMSPYDVIRPQCVK